MVHFDSESRGGSPWWVVMFVVGLYVLGGRFLSRLGFTLYNYLLVKK